MAASATVLAPHLQYIYLYLQESMLKCHVADLQYRYEDDSDAIKEILLHSVGHILSGLVALSSQPPPVSLVRYGGAITYAFGLHL